MSEPKQIVLLGDCREVLKTLADNSVHCSVTSPPYWNQRDYGVAGQIGLEATPAEYVQVMVEVFREVRRVLRPDGTLWLNLGDTYANDLKWGGSSGGKNLLHKHGYFNAKHDYAVGTPGGFPATRQRKVSGLPSKSLIGIPWRVAFALQDDGWILRQEIIWNKLNPMPESVTDRPSRSHEQIFLFSKSEHYYYDAEAIKEPVSGGAHSRGHGKNPKRLSAPEHVRASNSFDTPFMVETRNKRSVWTLANQPYSDAHFATFPEKLIEPCILAGCPSRTCEYCGTGWVRILEKGEPVKTGRGGSKKQLELIKELRGEKSIETSAFLTGTTRPTKTIGWKPSCKCPNNTGSGGPGVVLDPFGGSGTTARVAMRLNRSSILIELNPDYLAQIQKRTSGVQRQFAQVEEMEGSAS